MTEHSHAGSNARERRVTKWIIDEKTSGYESSDIASVKSAATTKNTRLSISAQSRPTRVLSTFVTVHPP
jgi:hypothetical protein